MDENSIWKKEITFRRKPKATAKTEVAPVPAAAEATSIWKKEITLRRKPKATASTEAAPAPAAETSIWKKEITFRRKPKATEDRATVEPARSSEHLPTPESSWPVDPPAEQILPPIAPPTVPPVTSPAPVAPPSYETVEPPVQPASIPSAGWSIPPVTLPSPVESQDDAVVPVAAPEPVVSVDAPSLGPPVEPPGAPQEIPWAPPVAPPAATPAVPTPDLEPEPAPVADVDVPTLSPDVEPTAGPEPALAEPTLSRRESRKARQAAEQAAKEQRQRTEQLAKDARKSNPSMHSRVVGLKIGASQIAAAEVVNKAGPRVIRMARMPLERGVVVGGELRDPDKLAAELKTFFRKNKLPRSCVRLGVSNNRIGVRTFEIAGIEDEKQLANAIRFRAQEALPIPLDEAVLDHRILDERFDDEGVRIRRVLLVVAHRELVERYVGACRKAGLKLIGIDLEAFALLRALADPSSPPAEDAAAVCITIGHDRSTLAVSDGRICEFTRVLSWGGSALDAALARVLDLTPSAAEPVRRRLSLNDDGETAGLDDFHAEEARRAIAAELQVFAREIVASLRFYQEQPGSLGISDLLITGGAAATGGLAAELGRLIGIPVRVGDPLGRVKVARKLRSADEGETGSLAVAVGLGIED